MITTETQTRAHLLADGIPRPVYEDRSLPSPPSVDDGEQMPDVGDRVGRYVIEQRIGEGGMGVVYRAFDPEVGRNVALKFARARRGTIDAKVWSRLRREAQALGRIRDDGVVGLYEMGHDRQGVFLALELVHGVHLRRWLQQRPRTVAEIVKILERAARALSAVHRANLVHRDIKPTNILVGPDDRVVLVDFGLALGMAELETARSGPGNVENTCRTRMTRTNMVVGTTNYMSPEQLMGRDVDPRSDVFSLAVTAYEALFDERPFPETTAYALAVAFDAGGPPIPPRGRVPRSVRDALLDALEIDPAARTATADDFAAALRPPRSAGIGLVAALMAGALFGAGGVALGARGVRADPPTAATRVPADPRGTREAAVPHASDATTP